MTYIYIGMFLFFERITLKNVVWRCLCEEDKDYM